MIKITDELVSAFGASNPAEFAAKLTELVASIPNAVTAARDASDAVAALSAEVELLKAASGPGASASDIKSAIQAIDFTATEDSAFTSSIKSIAANEGSRVACEVLARTGTNPIAPSAPQPTETAAQAAESNGDWKAQYAADAAIKAEFISAEVYDAFKRAEADGKIRIATKR